MAQIAAVSTPIGIFPQFFAAGPETIVLKEKVLSWSGDDFHIKLVNGTPILRVEGKVWSIGGRKKVFDMQGNHLFDIIKEHFHLHTTFVLEDAKGQKIMEVKNAIKLFGSKATASFASSQSGKQEALTMKGSWTDFSADITDEAQGGVLVARINRKISGKDLFFGQQTYGVQVAPGVDMALIAAMCICLDEKNNER